MSTGTNLTSTSGGEHRSSRTITQRLVTAAWLLFVWLALRGSLTVASFVGGAVVVGIVMGVFRHVPQIDSVRHTVRPLGVVRYVAFFIVEVVRANVEVAIAVMSPSRVADKRAIIEVPLPRSSRLVEAFLANAVSLTPGTSIIEVLEEPPTFHVHVLNMSSADMTRSSIAELHVRLVRAIGPSGALADVEAYAAELRERVALEGQAQGSDA
ncbi:MAG: Na+/H+ antiporter subunit E [Microthrixaceae bacterium]|nr:Na+/H+ antiporter subunit E [Microthrixaceae bacterium]